VELKQVREVISEEFLFFWFAVEAYFVEYSGEFVHGHQFTLGRGQRLFNLLNFGDIELLGRYYIDWKNLFLQINSENLIILRNNLVFELFEVNFVGSLEFFHVK
jgi:hypothetical protein